MKKIKGLLQVVRPQGGGMDGKVIINVEDDDAGVKFLEIEIPYDQFVIALTSGTGKMEFKPTNLDHVGKVAVRDKVEFPCSLDGVAWGDRQTHAYETALKHVPEGWEVSSYFSSRDSFCRRDGVEMATANIIKWVDKQ